jgi:hypothetical protein
MEYENSKEDPLTQTVRTNQHKYNNVTGSKKPQERITGRKKRKGGQHSRKDIRNMAREEDAWTTVT